MPEPLKGNTMADTLFTAPLQMVWHAPKKRDGCGRDPAAGPGTCYHWWEGCPKAEKRGCYQLWARAQAAAGNVPDGPGRAKKPEGENHG